jgi:ribosomal protein S18 acetylase RimI-like enzyme
MAEVVLPLTIRDLTRDDLPLCAWTGSSTSNFAAALDRADRGEVEYLVVCPPSGLPVAVAGIDFALSAGAGTLYQLAVHGAVQSCGIGSLLIGAAEQRIRARGLHRAELAVELNNPRARALYDRLGYIAYGTRPEEWDEQADDGSVNRYRTACTLMRKELGPSRRAHPASPDLASAGPGPTEGAGRGPSRRSGPPAHDAPRPQRG